MHNSVVQLEAPRSTELQYNVILLHVAHVVMSLVLKLNYIA